MTLVHFLGSNMITKSQIDSCLAYLVLNLVVIFGRLYLRHRWSSTKLALLLLGVSINWLILDLKRRFELYPSSKSEIHPLRFIVEYSSRIGMLYFWVFVGNGRSSPRFKILWVAIFAMYSTVQMSLKFDLEAQSSERTRAGQIETAYV